MSESPLDALRQLLPDGIVALVGAGCSTESGIPDYRGEGTARRARNPIQDRAFRTDPEMRRRYWARSLVGWPRIAAAQPNDAHRALARLEADRRLIGVITQNVDGLHHAAGSREVVELHGALRRIVCLSCGARRDRDWLQAALQAANPDLPDAVPLADGDAQLEPPDDFRVVPCDACGGAWMPDLVFFGGAVPRDRVDRAQEWVDDARALLVVGSSLTVFSGYRFVKQAVRRGIGVGIVGLGPTRGDKSATVKVEGLASEVLTALADGPYTAA